MAITGIFDVKSYGATGNGTTDDSAAIQRTIQAALAANSGGKTVYFPQGRYRIENYLTVNDPGLVLTGNDATLTTTQNTIYLTVQSAREISNLTFEKYYLYFPGSHKNNGKMYVTQCTFKNAAAQAIISDVSSGAMPSNLEITNNVFDGCSYAIYGAYSNSIIAGNTIQNTTNRNIEMYSGMNNVITGNRITSGVTAICFLLNRKSSQNLGVLKNIITHNIIKDISEEAISLDIHGNNTGSSGSVVKGTVSSIPSSTAIRIVPSFKLDPANAYLNLYVVFLSGKAKGQTYQITSMGPDGKSYLELANGNKSDIAVGDKIVLQVGVIGNIIANNNISNAQTGIDLYGDSFETVVTGNHVDNCRPDGLRVSSLYGVLDGSYGMVFNNTLSNNILRNANITVWTITFGPPVDINASGNVVSTNTIINGSLNYSYQDEILLDDNVIVGSGVTSIKNCPTALPTASAKYLGQTRFIKNNPGTADGWYICIQAANSTYQWQPLN